MIPHWWEECISLFHTSSCPVTSTYNCFVLKVKPFGFYAHCGHLCWRNSPIRSSVSRLRAWECWPEPRGWFLLSLLCLIYHLCIWDELHIWCFRCLIREKSFLLYPFKGLFLFCGSPFGSSDFVLHSMCGRSHSLWFRSLLNCWEWGCSCEVPSYCWESSDVFPGGSLWLLPICGIKFTYSLIEGTSPTRTLPICVATVESQELKTQRIFGFNYRKLDRDITSKYMPLKIALRMWYGTRSLQRPIKD